MKDKFFLWYEDNKSLFWGIIIGLTISILFLTIGFWRTLLIIVCVSTGAFLGIHPEVRKTITDFCLNLINKNKNTNGY